eukprot:FR740172.1.p2 GENE.FR740172.1~~FR740172.1.p2  ORF type:complete len:145 (+),score=20.78 FR740172.1:115-549(+)
MSGAYPRNPPAAGYSGAKEVDNPADEDEDAEAGDRNQSCFKCTNKGNIFVCCECNVDEDDLFLPFATEKNKAAMGGRPILEHAVHDVRRGAHDHFSGVPDRYSETGTSGDRRWSDAQCVDITISEPDCVLGSWNFSKAYSAKGP